MREDVSHGQPAEATIPDGKLCWADEVGVIMGKLVVAAVSDKDDDGERLSNS